jgi:F-type H+-transporting ATPase subunit beta
VLLFIDNIFRFSQAGSEVSALLGRSPSAVGYQPTLADEMERSRSAYFHQERSITSFKPFMFRLTTLPTRLRQTLSRTWIPPSCSTANFRTGHLPAVDRWRPHRRPSIRSVVGADHFEVARGVQKFSSASRTMQDIIAILGIDELSRRTNARFTARAAFKSSSPSRSLAEYSPI